MVTFNSELRLSPSVAPTAMSKTTIIQISIVLLSLGHGIANGAQLLPFQSAATGKFGFVDTHGHIMISPMFDAADDFSDGVASVRLGNTCEYIDNKGNTALVIPTCSSIEVLAEIDPDKQYYGPFVGGFARFSLHGKWGFINKFGSAVIPPQYRWAGDFSGGMAVVRVNSNVNVIDNVGHLVIQSTFDTIGSFSEGLASFSKDGKYGYIDSRGNVVIQPRFSNALTFSDGVAAVAVWPENSSSANVDELWGYIDRKGKFLLAPKYYDARPFSEGLAAVKVSPSSDWGYIDHNGSSKTAPHFKFAGTFSDGVARVTYTSIYTSQGQILDFSKLRLSESSSAGISNLQSTEVNGYIAKDETKIFTWSETMSVRPRCLPGQVCLADSSPFRFDEPPQVKLELQSNPVGAIVFAIPYLAYDMDHDVVKDSGKLAGYLISEGRTNLITKLFSQRYEFVFQEGEKKVLLDVPVFPDGQSRVSADFTNY